MTEEIATNNWQTLIPVLCTISGVILGFVGNWISQTILINHENKTRFHQIKLDIYSKYSRAITKFQTYVTSRELDEHTPEVLETYLNEFHKAKLVASDELLDDLTTMHELINTITESRDGHVYNFNEEIPGQYNSVAASIWIKIRKELVTTNYKIK